MSFSNDTMAQPYTHMCSGQVSILPSDNFYPRTNGQILSPGVPAREARGQQSWMVTHRHKADPVSPFQFQCIKRHQT